MCGCLMHSVDMYFFGSLFFLENVELPGEFYIWKAISA